MDGHPSLARVARIRMTSNGLESVYVLIEKQTTTAPFAASEKPIALFYSVPKLRKYLIRRCGSVCRSPLQER